MIKGLISFLFLFSIFSANAAISPNAGKVSLWLQSTTYDNAVFLPSDYDSSTTKHYPLIISLHGIAGSVLNLSHTAVGGYRNGFIKQVWGTTLARTYPAIVVAPNKSPKGTTSSGTLWNATKLRSLIIAAKAKYKVDPDRVVVTGYSAGSIASQELIRYSKDLLAGAMPGAYDPYVLSAQPCAAADLPVWVFGNNSDRLFKYTQWNTYKTRIQSCSNFTNDFKLTVYNSTCGHGCFDSHWAKPEVQKWLIQQVRR